MSDINSQMQELAIYSIKSAFSQLKNSPNVFSFEIFGYDFLIDHKGKVWLIEVNTNPCLEFTGSLTSRIIYHMVENSFRIALDPILWSHDLGNLGREEYDFILDENKYECII